MTREEAIEYLNKLYMKAEITDVYGDMDDTEPYETAIDMAIEALQEHKTGKWIYLGHGYKCPWSCSECDSCVDECTDYCPMCGSYNGGE